MFSLHDISMFIIFLPLTVFACIQDLYAPENYADSAKYCGIGFWIALVALLVYLLTVGYFVYRIWRLMVYFIRKTK